MLAKEQVYVAKNIENRAKKSFLCVLLWTDAEIDGEKHSVFFTTHLPEPANMASFSNNNPIVVHRTPTVRAVLWFRQGRLGRCL